MKQSHTRAAATRDAGAICNEPLRCRVCRCALDATEGDDLERSVCNSCSKRPEAMRLGSMAPKNGLGGDGKSVGARDFTVAEQSLIRRMSASLPLVSLLEILNERLASDLGPDAAPYTIEQLESFVGTATTAASLGALDWAATRKFLARARRDGTLAKIDETVISAFAVVFQLNTRQVIHLKDVVLGSIE